MDVGSLVVPDAQTSKLIQQCERPFDDPPPPPETTAGVVRRMASRATM